MTKDPHPRPVTARLLCAVIAFAYGAMLLTILAVAGDLQLTGFALLTGAVGYFTGNGLALPYHRFSVAEAVMASPVALVLFIIAGFGLATHSSSIASWMAIALGFGVGNRVRAAGPATRR